MSLIEEALRRAQTTPSKSEMTAPDVPPTSVFDSTPLPRWVNAKWWLSLAVGGTALMGVALWGYSIILRWQLAKIPVVQPQPLPPVPPQLLAGSPQSPAANPTASATLVKPKRPPVLTLNGIVEGRGEPLAIINGMILRIGERVAGATLLEIRKDEARLRWRDEELVLSTSR